MAQIADLAKSGFTPLQALLVGLNAELSITATGNASQANAYQLTANINSVSTATAITNSVKLPACESSPQGFYAVKNLTAFTVNVYPNTGDNIDALAANVGIALAAGLATLFYKSGTTSWLRI